MAQIFSLEYPQSLGLYDDYAEAQQVVDYLSDHDFPVENVLIVGTDLKQVERVTGRLTWGRVILSGMGTGAWFGLLVGLLLGIFAAEGQWWSAVLTGLVLGVVWGAILSAIFYALQRGQRDFSSVTTIRPGKFEILVEHRHLARGQELLAQRPGAATGF